jgi:hypothetical protein
MGECVMSIGLFRAKRCGALLLSILVERNSEIPHRSHLLLIPRTLNVVIGEDGIGLFPDRKYIKKMLTDARVPALRIFPTDRMTDDDHCFDFDG